MEGERETTSPSMMAAPSTHRWRITTPTVSIIINSIIIVLLIQKQTMMVDGTQLTFEIKKGTYDVGNNTREQGNSITVKADSPTQCVLKCNLKSMRAFYSTDGRVGGKCVCIHPNGVEAEIKFNGDGGDGIKGDGVTDSTTDGHLYEPMQMSCAQKGLFFKSLRILYFQQLGVFPCSFLQGNFLCIFLNCILSLIIYYSFRKNPISVAGIVQIVAIVVSMLQVWVVRLIFGEAYNSLL